MYNSSASDYENRQTGLIGKSCGGYNFQATIKIHFCKLASLKEDEERTVSSLVC